jgi:hypothetical protein
VKNRLGGASGAAGAVGAVDLEEGTSLMLMRLSRRIPIPSEAGTTSDAMAFPTEQAKPEEVGKYKYIRLRKQ